MVFRELRNIMLDIIFLIFSFSATVREGSFRIWLIIYLAESISPFTAYSPAPLSCMNTPSLFRNTWCRFWIIVSMLFMLGFIGGGAGITGIIMGTMYMGYTGEGQLIGIGASIYLFSPAGTTGMLWISPAPWAYVHSSAFLQYPLA